MQHMYIKSWCFIIIQEVIKRDEEVFKLIVSLYDIPIALLMGGGYQVHMYNLSYNDYIITFLIQGFVSLTLWLSI